MLFGVFDAGLEARLQRLDQLVALAAKASADLVVQRIAREPDLARRMGQAGRRRATEQFGMDRMVEETFQIYAGLIP